MRPAITDDYYAVLGLPQTASEGEINKRFKILALERHPDKNIGVPGATADFQRLKTAHDLLKDKQQRADYDKNIWPKVRKRDDGEASWSTPQTSNAAESKNKSRADEEEFDDDAKAQAHCIDRLYQRLETMGKERSGLSQEINKLDRDIKKMQSQDGTAAPATRDAEYLKALRGH